MSDRVKENVIEWLEGDRFATVTLSQKRFVNRVRQMSKTPENSVVIMHENDDGSILARIPLFAVHLFISGHKTGHREGVKG